MIEDHNWWVEVLCDDGTEYGFAMTSQYPSEAARESMRAAQERGIKPVCINSVTDNDTDETVYERGVGGKWHPDYEFRSLDDGKVKDCVTGEVHEPFSETTERDPHDPGPGWWKNGNNR